MKIRIFGMFLALTVILGGCGASGEEDSAPAVDISAYELSQGILEALGVDQWKKLDSQQAEVYLSALYALPDGSWTNAAICRDGGMQALEIAVIHLAEDADGEAVLEGLEEYRQTREWDFTGYSPEQAEITARSRAVLYPPWAALLICGDPDTAEEALAGLLSRDILPHEEASSVQEADPEWPDRIPFQAPGKENMRLYDTTNILTVWNGGEAELTEEEQEILDAASSVLAELAAEDMSGYDKELSVYGWLAGHVTYDQDHYDPFNGAPRDSYTPYNPLTAGMGVCLGFATTFQLLMDMWDVECLTVVGAAHSSQRDHAWNMVRLDGNWYCVDVTWDLGSEDPRNWRYFNVTSDYMARSNHQWDYGSVPEAVTEDRGRS